MSSSAAIEFKSTFRRLLRTAQRIVPPERSKFVQFEIRRRFRTRESDDIDKLRKEAADAFELMRVVIPKDAVAKQPSSTAGERRFRVRDGAVVQVTAAGASDDETATRGKHVVRDQRILPDQMERHIRLLRRQHFLDR